MRARGRLSKGDMTGGGRSRRTALQQANLSAGWSPLKGTGARVAAAHQSMADFVICLRRSHEPPLHSVIFCKQVFEVAFREAAGEAFFAEDIGDGLRLGLLQFPDLLLDGAGRDEAVSVDGLGLANPMRAVDGLGFNSRIPPGIVEDNVTGGGKVQAGSRGAQAEQEDGGVRIILERVHHFLSILGLAGEDLSGNLA